MNIQFIPTLFLCKVISEKGERGREKGKRGREKGEGNEGRRERGVHVHPHKMISPNLGHDKTEHVGVQRFVNISDRACVVTSLSYP